MNSGIWRTTHRFGLVMVALLLAFAAHEVAFDDEASMPVRIGGGAVLAVLALLSFFSSVRRPSEEPSKPERRPRKARR